MEISVAQEMDYFSQAIDFIQIMNSSMSAVCGDVDVDGTEAEDDRRGISVGVEGEEFLDGPGGPPRKF